MLSKPSTPVTSSFLFQTVSHVLSLQISLLKTYLPDISIKLASNNYHLWKAQIIPILHGYGLFRYVKNDVPYLVSTIIGENGVLQTNLEAAIWLGTNQLILGWINSFLSDGPISQVINNKSSHDA